MFLEKSVMLGFLSMCLCEIMRTELRNSFLVSLLVSLVGRCNQ